MEMRTAIGPADVWTTSSADDVDEALRDDRHLGDVAFVDDDAELVAGEAAEPVAGPHAGADPPCDRADHLVGDVVAVGLVDDGEIVDAGEQESHGAPVALRRLDHRVEHLREARAGSSAR